ncbi:MAG: tRNA glutamyl-Q(34) synthetase GluQRS [Planctomycetota bacterium]|nr:tRNA glutamyl-Q(34) synthetase GluQRS [Planctomycetota bacterium]
MADAPDVVGRLAPSPTGRLHLGHARSFLIAWWSARAQGGRVVLRIEDLDGERVKPGATELVLEDLAWLGLDWDGEPLLQTRRAPAHREALESLVQQGLAYPCVCTRREIGEAASAPHGDTGEQPYPGTCRGRYASVDEARAATGREPAIRLAVDPSRGPVAFEDAIQGACAVDVAAAAGDFVIGRKDGKAAYQLATPLDDAHQAVTEVVRGADLIPSAGRQALVLESLGLDVPHQAHVGLVESADGLRLAKRAGALSLEELRGSGVSPERIATWAAASVGRVAAGAPRPASAWIDGFTLQSVPPHPARLAPKDPLGPLPLMPPDH